MAYRTTEARLDRDQVLRARILDCALLTLIVMARNPFVDGGPPPSTILRESLILLYLTARDERIDAIESGRDEATRIARLVASDQQAVTSQIGTVLGAFIVTFLVMLAVVGIIGAISNFGPIAAIATWLWLITFVAVGAAILASIWTYRSTTASAVTREERI